MKRKIIALVLALTIVLSLVPMTTMSASAEISAQTFETWATNQLYTRCLSTAGSVIQTIGEASGSTYIGEFTSFINCTFCGGSSDDTSEQLAQLQATCNDILDTTKKVESVANDINAKMANDKITANSSYCDNAWESQVMDYITKADESSYDFYNVYIAYRSYLNYAANPSSIPSGKTLDYYENRFIDEIINYYMGKTNANFASEKEIYTTDTIDVCFTGIINSILNTMDPKTTSVGMGKRFIDLAAQYAYYAYPYSSEQAEFVDYATQYQVNTVTYLLMIYQDFLAHRADYFENNKDNNLTQAYDNIWECCYEKHYEPTLDKFTASIQSFLNGDIYLKEIDAHTTLDKYVRGDSATIYYDNEKESFTLTNNNYKTEHRNRYVKCTTEYYYNSDITSYPEFTNKNMSFYKNASVTVEDKKMVFTPFYVLNSDSLDDCYEFLKSFDLNDEDVHGEIKLTAFYDTHYLDVDYYNLKDGKFCDGVNTYVPVSDVSQLKGLINETYYTANKCTPYSYFSSFIDNNSNNPVYLLLNGKPTISRPENTTHYTKFPVFNMNTQREYSTDWTAEMMSLYNLQSDRKDSENMTNSMYTLILIPQSDVTKSKVDTHLIGEGKITVDGLENDTANAGDKIKVSVTAPENHSILKVSVTYHNDNKPNDTKVIYEGVHTNELTFEFSVPYSNITITAETAQIPDSLDTDENGSYLVSSYSDLLKMAKMVNSGYQKYTSGDYILTNNIKACDNGFLWSTPIGAEGCPFSGTFDGKGYTITDFVCDPYSTESNFSLFGVVEDGSIENFNLVMATSTACERHYCTGTICGYIQNGCISNCTVSGNFNVTADYAGGIVGIADSSIIKNCETKLDIQADKYTIIGDICGNNTDSEIVDCVSDNKLFVFPF